MIAVLLLTLAVPLPSPADAIGGAPPPSRPSSAVEARAVLDEVLSTSEFSHLRQKQVSWWTRFWNAVRDILRAIERFFDDLPEWVWWTALVWLILALVVLLGHLVYTVIILSGGAGRREGRTSMGGPDDELLGVRDLTFDSVYRRARELTAGGRFADAVRHWYVAAILWLDRSGRISFQASKTNYDYIRELTPDPVKRSGFQTMTQGFESCVYGEAPPSADGCRTMATILEGWVTEGARINSN